MKFMRIIYPFIIGFVIMSDTIDAIRDKPIQPPSGGGRQKPKPNTPIKNETQVPIITNGETLTPSPIDDVGVAIEKTKTRIKKNYEHQQKYYDKITNRPSIDSTESVTDSETQEVIDIDIKATDAFLRSATFTDEETGDSPKATDKIKHKLLTVTQSALDNAKDGIEDLLSDGRSGRRKKKKAVVGTIGGLVIFALTLLLIVIVKKI